MSALFVVSAVIADLQHLLSEHKGAGPGMGNTISALMVVLPHPSNHAEHV